MRRTPGLRDIHNTKARSLLALQAASLFALLFAFFCLAGGGLERWEDTNEGGAEERGQFQLPSFGQGRTAGVRSCIAAQTVKSNT